MNSPGAIYSLKVHSLKNQDTKIIVFLIQKSIFISDHKLES